VTEAQHTHPTLDRLVAFRMGRLPEGSVADVQSHLADCETCRTIADSLNPEALLSLLHASLATPAPTPPEGSAVSPGEAETLPPETAPLPVDPGIPPELADHPRYRVLELLGSGGMGRVYKAEHRIMERIVALKVINRNLVENPAAVERFRREVKTAARLIHPNIVTAFDAEQVEDCHFLVMEYVEGHSLDRVVQTRGRLPLSEACDYVRQAALGLQYAHERGMVHRDIKPQNLMRTPEGRVKILDFGLARFLSEGKPATALTQFGVIMGTPDYIAPEQAHDPRAADIRADIYSLGCTLYYLLAGRVPFPDGSMLQKLMAQVDKTPTPLTQMRSDMPPELVRIVDRMVAKDPARRYQTPAEVARDLVTWSASPAERPTLDFVPSSTRPETGSTERVRKITADPPAATEELPEVAALPVATPVVDPIMDDRLEVLPVEDEPKSPPRRLPLQRDKSKLAHNLGIASIILGVVSFPLGCSCLGSAGGPLSGIGFLLGGAGLIITLGEGGRKVTEWSGAFNLRDKRISYPFAGMAVNAVAFLLAAVIAIKSGFSSSRTDAVDKLLQKVTEFERKLPSSQK
jgi:serine/threonine protein kinase